MPNTYRELTGITERNRWRACRVRRYWHAVLFILAFLLLIMPLLAYASPDTAPGQDKKNPSTTSPPTTTPSTTAPTTLPPTTQLTTTTTKPPTTTTTSPRAPSPTTTTTKAPSYAPPNPAPSPVPTTTKLSPTTTAFKAPTSTTSTLAHVRAATATTNPTTAKILFPARNEFEIFGTYDGPYLEGIELLALSSPDTTLTATEEATASAEQTASATDTKTAEKPKPAVKVEQNSAAKEKAPFNTALGWIPVVLLVLTVACGLWAKTRQLSRAEQDH